MTVKKTVSYEKPNRTIIETLMTSSKVSKQEKMALKSYYEKIDEKTGEVKVEYEIEQYGRFNGFARRNKYKTYTTGTSMKRIHRNLIFGEDYDDLDVANCSGSVMCQVFEKNGYDVTHMKHLNERREDVLQMIMDYNKEFNVERSTAKDILIEVFFCGSGHTSQYWEMNPFTNKKDVVKVYQLPPFVNELKREYSQNVTKLFELPEYKEMKQYIDKKKEENEEKAWIGTYASILYQDIERQILMTIVEGINTEAKKRKYDDNPIGSLIFDGLHVQKSFQVVGIKKQLEALVLGKTGYSIALEIKDMDVSEEDRKEYLEKTTLTYEAKRSLFEKNRFKTKNGKNPFYTITMEDGIEEIYQLSKIDFNTSNEDWIADAVPFLKDWFIDPEKRSYEDIEFACVKDENKKKNIFYAFPTLRYKTLASISTPEQKQLNIQFFREYISSIMEDHPIFTNTPGREQEEHYCKWMTYWIADAVINPDTKGAQPIAVVLWAKQGSGKSSLRNLMEKIFGRRCVHHTDDPTKNGDILHDFNKTLRYKLFIEWEEINLKIASTMNDRIKALVTNHTHTITPKGQDSTDVKATERNLFTTNHPDSVVIERGDRRYMAVAMSNKRCGDTTYWKEFYNKLNDDNFIVDVVEHLFSFQNEISKYAFRNERPITTYYKNLQHRSFPPELDFLKDLFLFRKEEMEDYLKDENLYFISSTTILNKYNLWRDQNGLREKVSVKALSMKLKSMDSSYGITFKERCDSNGWIIDSIALEKMIRSDYNIQKKNDLPILPIETVVPAIIVPPQRLRIAIPKLKTKLEDL
jgi:hypothetical protein